MRRAALALVVAAAVVAGTVQAGRTYWYCPAMQSVMMHACCLGRAKNLRAELQGTQTNSDNAAAWVAPECCQTRSMALLDACTPPARSAEPALRAHVVLAVPVRVISLVATRCLESCSRHDADASMRAGPKLREHARLMVFNI